MLVSQLDTLLAPDSLPVYTDIIAAWRQAAFTAVTDRTLARYFNDQLEGIAEIRDPLRQTELLDLVDHLWRYYPHLLDDGKHAPDVWRKRLINELALPLAHLKLTGCQQSLRNYLESIIDHDKTKLLSYSALNYFASLVAALSVSDQPGTICLHYNFNQLGYLADCQAQLENQLRALDLPERRQFLENEKARISALPERQAAAYDPAWPSLKSMLCDWLTEMIALLPASIPRLPKLTLNLSVAQLGCLLKAAHDENIFKEVPVSTVLRFFSEHFSAKKQSDISPGGLGKAYYGIEQVTAAMVIDRLQQMYHRLKRNFFPV